ncbi:hypothetical protein P4S64_06290 [Vibrio sp. M60_M31a]
MMITSSSTGVNSQSWDYLSNYTDVQAWIPKNMVIVNKRAFKRLPKRGSIRAFNCSEDRRRTWLENGGDRNRRETKELAEKGINVAQPTPELMEALKKLVKP